jgi:heme-degrading monooxygenase HmoA
MITTDGELVVIDEWRDEDQFRQFFDSAARMGEFLEGAGITGPPEISVFDSLDVPGTF